MVAKYRSVNIAAERLFISQPAVSNGLKRFQKELELDLFEKQGRLLVLNPVGEKLAELADQLFNAEDDIEQYISEVNKKRTGVIRMGVATLYERFAMVDLMSYFDDSKKATLSVTSGNSRNLIKRLNNHQVDMIITGKLEINEKMRLSFLKKHQVCLVAPEGHKLYGKSEFSLKDLDGESMVMKEEGSATRKVVSSYLTENRVNFNITAELSNLDSILELVSNEKCLTFLPDLALDLIQSHSTKSKFTYATPVHGEIFFSMYLVTLQEDYYPRWLWLRIQRFAENACQEDD